MRRRRLLASTIVGSVSLLSGCTGQQLPETPDKATLWIQNQTDSGQHIEVTVTDESNNSVLSEDYKLSPVESDDSQVRETGAVSLDETYSVQTTTTDYNANYKWETSEGTGILYIVINDEELSFSTEPFEG